MSVFRLFFDDVANWQDAVVDWYDGGGVGAPPAPPTPPSPPVAPPAPPVAPPAPPSPPGSAGTIEWVNLDPANADADVQDWVDAQTAQTPDIARLWPGLPLHDNVFVPGARQAGAIPATIRTTQSGDVSGALGWHGVGPDQYFAGSGPYIVILSDVCRQYAVSIPSVMSHERGETEVDGQGNLTVVAPDGTVWDQEIGDPVEASSYNVTTASGKSVAVSDLVGQAFFDLGPGPLDLTGAVTAPFTLAPGGYAVENGSPVYGEGHPRHPVTGDPDAPAHVPPPSRAA